MVVAQPVCGLGQPPPLLSTASPQQIQVRTLAPGKFDFVPSKIPAQAELERGNPETGAFDH